MDEGDDDKQAGLIVAECFLDSQPNSGLLTSDPVKHSGPVTALSMWHQSGKAYFFSSTGWGLRSTICSMVYDRQQTGLRTLLASLGLCFTLLSTPSFVPTFTVDHFPGTLDLRHQANILTQPSVTG